jgi:hypothetical protein
MNASHQGKSAGQASRKVVNQATSVGYEGGKAVVTAVGGFIAGFFSNPDAPAKRVRKTARK